ncbi:MULTISPECIES: DDE-type integrase/transposase/recombinase [unclassified Methylophaga]|uniref:DDE-type integrase/transposase/recombinase n=1 Tax=unclassified Methylophaga TaxID=2629249 RepID=UPI000C947001|nr:MULTISPECIES: DDE-type integrase/transposase/recombinase [unclassified Methylophaga]MAK65603.1 hypothetical protein [Methylophaga sp.]MAY16326.1 hypothetical protein [Methylophaga sp.]HCD06599.1 hypothetical protein [Methylophaga sp.]
MNTFNHIVGAHYKLGATTYELSGIDDNYYLLRSLEYKRQRSLKSENFEKLFSEGKLKLVKKALSDITDAVYFTSLTPQKKETFQRRLSYVEKVRMTFGSIIPKRYFKQFIELTAKELYDKNPPSFSTLNRWVVAYRDSNFNPASQLSVHDKKKVTRKRRIDDDVLELMHEIINNEYLVSERPSMQSVYVIFSDSLHYKNLSLPPDKQISIPSLMSFLREIKKIHPMTVATARYGAKTARKRFDYGRSLHYKSQLCLRTEIDTTPLDIMVLDENSAVVGHPYLLPIIDVYSRCVLGWDLSFIPGCAEKTLRTLKHAGSDATAREVGGLPIELVIDNGSEFINESLSSFAKYTGTTILINPPGTPNQKAFVESFFKTVNNKFLDKIKGKTFSSPALRGNYDSEKKASLTLNQLRKLFAKWVDGVYHLEGHSGIEDRAPISLWREEHKKLPTIRYDHETLNTISRSTTQRVITDSRVKMFGLTWTGPSVPIISEKSKSRGKPKPVEVLYDSSDLSTIWIKDPHDKSIFYEAFATRPFFQESLSLFEFNLLKQRGKFKDTDLEKELVLNRIALHEEIREQSTKHKSARKKVSKMEKAQQLLTDDNSEFLDSFKASPSYRTNSEEDEFDVTDFPDDGFLL